MVKKPEFFMGHRLEYELSNGHLICTCMALSYVTNEETDIEFIHDTGAFISTLSRTQYEQLDYDKIKADRHNVELGSYNSVAKGLVFTLPFLFLANFTVKNVQMFVPYSYNPTQNLLAMNVLGLFNQYIETDTSSIFLKPHNAAVDFRLIAESVFVQEGNKESSIKHV